MRAGPWAATAALAAFVSGTAQGAKPCLTTAEADAVIAMVMPDVLERIGRTCAASLSPGATLRGGLPPILARYRSDSARTKPDAASGLIKLSEQDVPESARPGLVSMMAGVMSEELAKSIEPKDCAEVDAFLTALEPLPPANMATFLRLFMSLDGTGGGGPFPICRAGKP